MNELCVYTVICGNYDSVNELKNPRTDIDYICFTNQSYSGRVPEGWEHIIIEQNDLRSSALNRYFKINIPERVRSYKYSVYVDGNITIKDIPKIIDNCCYSSTDIALYDHYQRDNIYDEANVCIEKGMDHYWRFRQQIKRYNKEGFHSNTLYEANVIFRTHSQALFEAMNVWWNEYNNGVKRDQIAFVYSMESKGIKITSLGKSDVRFEKKHFDIEHHTYPKAYLLKKKVRIYINAMFKMIFGNIKNG